MPVDAQRWLEKAKRHLTTAHLNADHKGFTDTTCYFTHQAVELALKAYLVEKKIDFPKVHALPQLLTLCIPTSPALADLADDMAFLNGFYIEAKYPLDVSFDPSEMDIVRAISIAEAVVSLVQSKL